MTHETGSFRDGTMLLKPKPCFAKNVVDDGTSTATCTNYPTMSLPETLTLLLDDEESSAMCNTSDYSEPPLTPYPFVSAVESSISHPYTTESASRGTISTVSPLDTRERVSIGVTPKGVSHDFLRRNLFLPIVQPTPVDDQSHCTPFSPPRIYNRSEADFINTDLFPRRLLLPDDF